MKTILQAIGGSHAYGLATETSDIDRYGIFVEPVSTILGVIPYSETKVTNKPDATYHEVGKYIQLALKANPTIFDLLYLNDYEVCTPEGKLLVESRDAFLSKTIFHSYGGYAISQARRLNRRGDGTFSSDHRTHYAKHARHCFRLLDQGRQLLETGTMNVKVRDRDELFALGEMPVDKLVAHFEEAFKEFDKIVTKLPNKPDYKRANDLLLLIRGMNNDL